MQVIVQPIGQLKANCYILKTDINNGIVIDPGPDYKQIQKILDDNKIKLNKILLTHGHYDHLGGVTKLKRHYQGGENIIKVYAHELEVEMCRDVSINLAYMFNDTDDISFTPEVILKDGDKITLDDVTLKVMHTPGHTRGGVVYIEETQKIMFTGDTIFNGYTGRVDLPGGSEADLRKSLIKIAEYQDSYILYGGHELPSTIEKEKQSNYHFKIALS